MEMHHLSAHKREQGRRGHQAEGGETRRKDNEITN
jgi:hypothetical protein